MWWALYQAEPLLCGSRLRNKALAECMRHIHYEDVNTRYIDIGPVNKVGRLVLALLCDVPLAGHFLEKHALHRHWARQQGAARDCSVPLRDPAYQVTAWINICYVDIGRVNKLRREVLAVSVVTQLLGYAALDASTSRARASRCCT